MGMIKKKFRRIFNWRGRGSWEWGCVYYGPVSSGFASWGKGNNLSKYRKVAWFDKLIGENLNVHCITAYIFLNLWIFGIFHFGGETKHFVLFFSFESSDSETFNFQLTFVIFCLYWVNSHKSKTPIATK